MWYFDTNVLVYSVTAMDESKMRKSQKLVNRCVKSKTLLVSPINLQELIFALSKLKVEQQVLTDSVHTFLRYSKYSIDSSIVKEAFELSNKIDFCKNINDAIHLKFAEKHCQKLITFDKHFEKFKSHSKMNIEILKD